MHELYNPLDPFAGAGMGLPGDPMENVLSLQSLSAPDDSLGFAGVTQGCNTGSCKSDTNDCWTGSCTGNTTGCDTDNC